ncbi:MAG: YHS domain-containing protein [Candidatus Brocadia sp.]|nr:YHS domain-containing protein [Candidatus Brocadia sp.]
MEVNKDKAIKLEHDGKAYYFCSKMCEETFKKDPSKYLKEKEK